jgi:DNA-binding transcriptional ArsR family regulator
MPSDSFAAIADPTRRAIMALLAYQELPVHAIADRFPMSRPAISKHLRILRDAGLVRERRIGRLRLYRAAPEMLRDVRTWVLYFDQFWLERLQALKALVEEDP